MEDPITLFPSCPKCGKSIYVTETAVVGYRVVTGVYKEDVHFEEPYPEAGENDPRQQEVFDTMSLDGDDDLTLVEKKTGRETIRCWQCGAKYLPRYDKKGNVVFDTMHAGEIEWR